MAEPRSQYPVRGFSHRTGVGGLVQGEGSHKEKVKVLLFHMANKPTATVMARKLSATIHRTREVVGVVSVLFIFVLSLSFPAAGPRANREKKQIKVSEKRLWQEAADMQCLLSAVPEHTLLESSREEGESPEPSWEKQGQQVLLSQWRRKAADLFWESQRLTALLPVGDYQTLPLSSYRLVHTLPSSIKPLTCAEDRQILKIGF